MTREVQARVVFKKHNIWIHGQSGGQAQLRHATDYKPQEIRHLVGKLKVDKEIAKKHFPELF